MLALGEIELKIVFKVRRREGGVRANGTLWTEADFVGPPELTHFVFLIESAAEES